VTQPGQTITTADRANGFTLGIFLGIAGARLVSALTATEFPSIRLPSGYQPPANDAPSLIAQGITDTKGGLAKHQRPEPAPIADLERQFEAGGEGVEASARSQSSQYISPSRKFSHCHRP
jgi:hypothetical protein